MPQSDIMTGVLSQMSSRYREKEQRTFEDEQGRRERTFNLLQLAAQDDSRPPEARHQAAQVLYEGSQVATGKKMPKDWYERAVDALGQLYSPEQLQQQALDLEQGRADIQREANVQQTSDIYALGAPPEPPRPFGAPATSNVFMQQDGDIDLVHQGTMEPQAPPTLTPLPQSTTVDGKRGVYFRDQYGGIFERTPEGLMPVTGEVGVYEAPDSATAGTLFERFKNEYGDEEGTRLYYEHLANEAQARALPPAQTQAMADLSRAIVPTIDKVEEMLADRAFQQKLGPVMGRWNEFMTGNIGAGDPDFAKFRTLVSLVLTGAMRAHVGARGSTVIFQHFMDLVNSGTMNSAVLGASLGGMKEVLQGYTQMAAPRGQVGAPSAPPTSAPTAGGERRVMMPDGRELIYDANGNFVREVQ